MGDSRPGTRSSRPSTTATVGGRGGATVMRKKIALGEQMDKRPYLDKIVMKINIPEDVPGHSDFVSVSHDTFPDLYKYTGIKSKYETPTVLPTDCHGMITPQYKVEAYESLKPIYRDEQSLNGREAVFKRSHKQFMDDILKDMDRTHITQSKRQLKYWTKNKNDLGFSQSFNLDTQYFQRPNDDGKQNVRGASSSQTHVNDNYHHHEHSNSSSQNNNQLVTQSSSLYQDSFEECYSADQDFEDAEPQSKSLSLAQSQPLSQGPSHSRGQSPPILSSDTPPLQTLAPAYTPSTNTSPFNPNTQQHSQFRSSSQQHPQHNRPVPGKGLLPANSSAIIQKIGYRPPNKMALFNALLETTSVPKSPRKCYGTVDFSKSQIDFLEHSLHK